MVLSRNPVHSALCLVATLFGIAVLFVAQDANFLAAVQVIVYAGAIVVLFLFVIMLLGVDRTDDLDTEPLVGQRPLALVVGVAARRRAGRRRRRQHGHRASAAAAPRSIADVPDIEQIGRLLFTDYLFAFEITSVLLVIAVVGAVVLARAKPGDQIDEEPVAECGRRRRGRGRRRVIVAADPVATSGTSSSARCSSRSAPSACWSGATRS